MSDELEQPRLRKRSEVGKAKTQEMFGEERAAIDPGFQAGFMGAGAGIDEDLGAFAKIAKEAGLKFTLVDAAQWGTEGRNAVRRWFSLACPKATMPAFLEKHIDMTASALAMAESPVMSDEPQWPKQTSGDQVGVTPSPEVGSSSPLTDRVPAESVPARAKQKRRKPPTSEAAEVADDRELASTAAPVMLKEDLPEAWGGDPETAFVVPKVEVAEQYQRFVDTVMAEIDIEAEYDDLEAALEIGAEQRSYSVINEHVDKAQRRAQRANHVWAQAVIEHERLKLDQKEVDAALWKQAMASLEKDGRKTRIADVDAQIAEMFPDEWREGKLRVKRSELAVERCKSFQDRWAQRERALVGMLSACRKA